MQNNQANESIKCTVEQCQFHCKEKEFCSLPKIKVGTHEANPTVPQCIDCESFKVKE